LFNHVPPDSRSLIALLDASFPARPPDPAETEREIWMKAGERRLIEAMKSRQAEQDETILESPVTASTYQPE